MVIQWKNHTAILKDMDYKPVNPVICLNIIYKGRGLSYKSIAVACHKRKPIYIVLSIYDGIVAVNIDQWEIIEDKFKTSIIQSKFNYQIVWE